MPRCFRMYAIIPPVFAALLLGACAQTQLAVHTLKRMQGQPGERDAEEVAAGPHYKVGDAYQIDGVWYYPSEVESYSEEGVASWYGADFHEQVTANGEIYDMAALTAAHRTLPMPSAVEVTNLANGRSLTLRVNDRGPFVNDRIIDVSRRAAQLLGFERKGTARVRVRYLEDRSRRLKLAALNSPIGKAEQVQVAAAPTVPVETSPLSTIEAQPASPVSPSIAALSVARIETMPRRRVKNSGSQAQLAYALNARDGRAQIAPRSAGVGRQAGRMDESALAHGEIYVQVGAFSFFSNALSMRDRIAHLGHARISQFERDKTTLYRVRVGPVATLPEAQSVLSQVIDVGVSDAQIVMASECAAPAC